MQDGCRFVAAALLKAIRESEFIDIKPGIEWLYRNYQVYKLKTARQLATQVYQTFAGLAHKSCDNYDLLHRRLQTVPTLQAVHPNKKTAGRRPLHSRFDFVQAEQNFSQLFRSRE
jgi:hypothetical protein